MNAIDIALPRLQTEEGFRALPYEDTNGFTTIGYGFNIDAGIGRAEAAALLAAQLQSRDTTLAAYPWYSGLDPARKSVLLDMAFNLGLAGLLRFPNLLLALQGQDWVKAQAECQVKDPALQARYSALGKILLTGAIT